MLRQPNAWVLEALPSKRREVRYPTTRTNRQTANKWSRRGEPGLSLSRWQKGQRAFYDPPKMRPRSSVAVKQTQLGGTSYAESAFDAPQHRHAAMQPAVVNEIPCGHKQQADSILRICRLRRGKSMSLQISIPHLPEGWLTTVRWCQGFHSPSAAADDACCRKLQTIHPASRGAPDSRWQWERCRSIPTVT